MQTEIQSLVDLYVKGKIIFERGQAYFGYLQFVMIIFITVSQMRTYPLFAWLSGWYWFGALFVGIFGTILFVGYLEIRWNIWQRQTDIYARLNPLNLELLKNQKEILEEVKRNANNAGVSTLRR